MHDLFDLLFKRIKAHFCKKFYLIATILIKAVSRKLQFWEINICSSYLN